MSDLATGQLKVKFDEYVRLLEKQHKEEAGAHRQLYAALSEWHESVIGKQCNARQLAEYLDRCSGYKQKLKQVKEDRQKIKQAYLPYYEQEWHRFGLLANRPELL